MPIRFYPSTADRAISPVVGTVLFLAIVLLLVAISGTLLFNLTEQQDPAPQAQLVLEPVGSSDEHRLVHKGGDAINGSRVRIRSIADPDTLAGTTLTAGDEIPITPTGETVRIVWSKERQEPSSYVLSTFAVALSSSSSLSTSLSDSVLFTATDNGILRINGTNSDRSDITTDSAPTGLGPASDIDSDGTIEIPYVDSSENVALVTPGGTETTLVTGSDISDTVETSKTRLAVGTWNGSDPSVFFATPSKIQRVTTDGTVVEVAEPPDDDDVDGVIGPSDIDDDGSDELVFIDGSQAIQYLEGDGSTSTLYTGAGSDTGVGGGAIADYDGDDGDEVAIVDGGNNIVLSDTAGNELIDKTDVDGSSAPQAKKSPSTAADVDGDGSDELVYLGLDDGKLNYLDNIDGSGNIVIKDLTDASGNDIGGKAETGVT